ncbi:MAG: hypothetical protein P1U56_13720 [Saprospiraceae bacterium]|nr:hypothetical protein [Saprospiraceae bacterium]
MGNTKYDIDRYDYSLELQPTDEGIRSKTFATLSLFSDGKNVADINILNPGEKPGRKYFAGHQLNIDIIYEKLAPTLDMLRHEKPLRLLVWHSGTHDDPTHIEARLDKGDLEQVGQNN